MDETKTSHRSSLDTINKLIADADSAADAINAALKEASSVYRERFRKVRDLKAQLHALRNGSIGELFDLQPLLTPELGRLLVDPTHGL